MRDGDLFEAALATACRAADQARKMISVGYTRQLESVRKEDGSPVTYLDRQIELAIRAELGRVFPDHSILGEEHAARRTSSRYAWVIDPIDGTVALLNRVPTFAVLLALCDKGRPIVSVVDLPALGERYTALEGQGAWCNGTRLAVSTSYNWSSSIACHGDRHTFDASGYGELYSVLDSRIRFFRSYTDAFGHTLVARGSAVLMVDAAMEVWDLAAPLLLVEEAAGRVLLLPDRKLPRRYLAVAGAPSAVDEVEQILLSLGMPCLQRDAIHLA